jgi:predicted Zn-dependent protease
MAQNVEVFTPFVRGALAIAEADAPPLPPDTLAELAISYASVRSNGPIARELVRRSDERGGSPLARVATAELKRSDASAEQAAAAAHSLDGIVAARPQSVVARLARANWYLDADDFASALADADATLQLQPGDWRARLVRFRSLLGLDRKEEAAVEGNALLASPYLQVKRDLLMTTAALSSDLDRTDEAIVRLRRSLERDINWPPLWQALAGEYEKAGRAEEAKVAAANAEIAKRNMVLVTHARARRAEFLSGRASAIGALQAALNLDPNYEPAKADLRRLGVRPE